MDKSSLLIGTIPNSGGGVNSMRRVTCSALKDDFNIGIINSPSDHSDSLNLSLRKIINGKWQIDTDEIRQEGIKIHRIGRYFHYLEPFHYLDNAYKWLQCTRKYDRLMVVSGSIQCGLAFALGKRPFISWIATTTKEDKLGRKNSWSYIRRIIDTAWTPLLQILEGYIYKRCSKIFVLSNYVADLITKRYKIDKKKIEILYYPIDTVWFKPLTQKAKTSKFSIVTISRFTDPRKNIQMLVKAFSIVKKNVPTAKLILVGDNPTAKIINLVERLSLQNSVEFPGVVSNKMTLKYYQNASVFALSSYQEGLAIVGLEAMACGLPVVTTKCGGPEDYVNEGITGFIVPINDETYMADALIKLILNPKLQEKIGSQACKWVENNCDMETFSKKLLENLKIFI